MSNNLIQIKRSTSTPTPSTLNPGELAYSNSTQVLYIGSTDGGTVVPLAGARTPGTLTANQALVANSTSGIDRVYAANVELQYLVANGSPGTSGYVLFSGGSSSNAYWASAGSIGVNTAAQYTWTNTQTFSNTITFNQTINGTANNALYLGGTAAASYATQSYVTGQGYITSSALSGYATESYADTAAGTAYANATSYADGTAATAYANAVAYANTAAATAYSNGTSYADSKASTAYSNALSTTLSRNGSYTGNNTFGGTNTVINSNTTFGGIAYFGSSVGTAIVPTANGTQDLGNTTNRWGKLYLAGSTIVLGNTTLSATGDALTANAIIAGNATIGTIIGTTTSISSNVSITAANIDATSAYLRVRDASISGNLTISGTLTTVDTNNLQVKDSMIKLADQNTTTDIIDTGFYAASGNSSATYYSGLYRDHGASSLTTPVFKLFTSNTEPTSVVDNTAPGYILGTLNAYLNTGAFVSNSTVVNITANSTVSSALVANSLTLTTALAASYGGTGQASYTTGDILYASASSTLSKLSVPGSAANGQVLQIVNNLPAYGTLDGGTF
jgi:hypothetical protein